MRSSRSAYGRTARDLYGYDDLRSICDRKGRSVEVAERIPGLREAHTKKSRFLAR
jgi:hypothetical protein